MTEKTVAEKARIKPGASIAVLNRVPGVVESLGLPDDVKFVEPTDAQLVFLFVSTRAELDAQMPAAAEGLALGSALWVFYRKGSTSAGLDMNRDTIWAIAEGMGLRPLGLVRIDDTWTAFRLRPEHKPSAKQPGAHARRTPGTGPALDPTETPEERLRRVTSEPIDIIPYDPAWPARFEREKQHLLSCLPADLVLRVEHFGSTAVPALAAKPIVDILVEVTDLEAVRERIVPLLTAQGYEYFWRPTFGDDGPPYYAWFIKRDPATGMRTHHVHMVESDFAEHWDRLLFRDYLIEHPAVAKEYEALKRRLAEERGSDRVRYTREKTEFIAAVTNKAKNHYGST